MASSPVKSVAQEVVKSLLGDGSGDEMLNDIYALTLRLSRMCKDLGVDETQSQTGFHVPLSQLAIDVLKLEEYKKLLNQLDTKNEQVEVGMKKLAEKFDEGKRLQRQLPAMKIENQKEMKELDRRLKENRMEVKEIQKKLDQLGFTDSLDDKSMSKLESDVVDQEAELERLESELKQFEGVEPNDGAIKKRLEEMKEELNNFRLLNDSGSLF